MRLLAALPLLLVVAVLVPGQADARTWRAKVVHVHDGDTLDVRLGGRTRRVRITGINAPELTRYSSDPRRRRGDCHGVEATARTERLVRASRKRVRLSARRASSRSGSRLRRAVAVRRRGRWIDVGTVLVREGHALWLPAHVEYQFNRRYSVLAARAAARGLRVYDPDACGPGPAAGARLRLWANWDAEGADAQNLNDEWVRIKNDGEAAVALGGWWVRDSDLRRHVLPRSAVVAPGATITVRVGRGTDSGSDFFWGLREPVFENVKEGRRAIGDGAYLFDPDGDLRAHMLYPCRVNCSDPLVGAVELGASPRRDEYATLLNVSAAPVDLEGYRLQTPHHGYAFRSGSVIAPGETMRVETQGDPRDDTRLEKHWGFGEPILRDRGERLELVTYSAIRIACTSWGSGDC